MLTRVIGEASNNINYIMRRAIQRDLNGFTPNIMAGKVINLNALFHSAEDNEMWML